MDPSGAVVHPAHVLVHGLVVEVSLAQSGGSQLGPPGAVVHPAHDLEHGLVTLAMPGGSQL